MHVIVQEGRRRIVLSGEVDADLSADLTEATTSPFWLRSMAMPRFTALWNTALRSSR